MSVDKDLESLESAALTGNLEEIERLTRNQENSSEPYYAILKKAVSAGQKAAAKLLIKRGWPLPENFFPPGGNEILHAAVRTGDFELIKLLIDRKVCIKNTDKDGLPPFFKVVHIPPNDTDYDKFLDCLLSKEITISFKNNTRLFTILHYAAEVGNPQIIKILLQRRNQLLNAKAKDNSTALHIAVQNRHSKVVEELLKLDAKDGGCNNDYLHPIQIAVKNHDLETFQIILKHILDKSVTRRRCFQKDANRPLVYLATLEGHKEMLELLLSNNAPIDYFSKKDKQTSLHLAVEKEDAQLVAILLKYDPKLEIYDKNGLMPLHVACVKGNFEIVSLIVNAGKPNADAKKNIVNANTSRGATALHLAVKEGHDKIVSLLLEKGAEYKEVDQDDKTPLSYALENSGKDDILYTLLMRSRQEHIGESVNLLPEDSLILDYYSEAKNAENGNSALHLAVIKEDKEAVNLFLKHRACIDKLNHSKHRPLDLATIIGSFEIVDTFLQSRSNPRFFFYSGEEGFTPMHFAVQERNLDMLDVFFKAGISADLSKVGYGICGLTPLHIAVRNGDKNMIFLLLENGARADVYGRGDFETPLFVAAERGDTDVVEILSQATLLRSKEWREGYLPMCIAAFKGHEKTVKMLLDKGVNPNTNSKDYLTPLHAAAQMGHESIVRLLLQHKASVNPENLSIKSTPLLAAAYAKHSRIVQLLLDHGADFNAQLNYNNPIISDQPTKAADQAPTQISNQASNSVSNQVSKSIPNQASNSVSNLASKSIPNQFSNSVSNQASKSIPNQISNSVSNQVSKSIPNQASKSIPNRVSKSVSNQVSNSDSNQASKPISKNLATSVSNPSPTSLADQLFTPFSKNKQILKQGSYEFPDSSNEGKLLHYRALHFAVANQDKVSVKSLIKSSAKINCKTMSGATAIGLAVEKEDEAMIKLLLAAGANIHEPHRDNSILDTQAVKTNVKIAELVVKSASLTHPSSSSENLTPLGIAVDKNLEKCVERLLKCKSNVNIDYKGEPILHYAIRNKNPKIVKMLLNQPISDSQISSALRVAVANDLPNVVELLLDSSEDQSDSEALYAAIRKRNPAIVEMFLRRGFLGTSFESPFRMALRESSAQVVGRFLQHGISTDWKEWKGECALYYAITAKNLQVVQFLLKSGARVNVVTNEGQSLVYYAMKELRNHVKIFQTLVDYGADLNRTQGNHALVFRMLNKNLEYPLWRNFNNWLNILLANGVEPNQFDMTGKTMLHFAIENEDVGQMRILLLNGADVNFANFGKKCALKVAIAAAFKRAKEMEENYGKVENHSRYLDNREYDEYYSTRMGEFGKRKTLPFRENVRLLVQEVARLQAAKRKVSGDNFYMVSLPYVKNYYERCQKEIDLMKETEICEGIPYFYMLVSNVNNLAAYARNVQVKRILLSEEEVTKRFPEFGEVLINRIVLGRDRRHLLDSSCRLLKFFLRFNFPFLVEEHIFGFLTNRDLRSLIVAKELCG